MTNSGVDPTGRIVLDTSAYSRMRAGHGGVLDRIAAAEIVSIPATVIGELEAGFQLGRRVGENRVALAEFLAEPFVSVLPTTSEVARRYGQVFAGLRRAGTPIPVNDIWIAAATLDCGAHLLTFDQDFQRIGYLDCTVLAA
ncbi:MAG: type II toxin-antitoxin system VapC family toxin [Acidobacteriota bacterium]